MKNTFSRKRLGAALVLGSALQPVLAQLVISDTLSGASSSYNWRALNGACLTAGNNTGTIPACVGLPYYNGRTLVGGTTGRLPDAVGGGALRLTNGDFTAGWNGNSQTGAVVSNFTFPTNQGLQVTFKTVTYGGNGFNGTGADGIVFFLMDGAQEPNVGAEGGSLGYSCSNVNGTYDGVVGAFLGVGIDEFGNFSNPGDNTDSGPGFRAGRISVRGAGNTAWRWLNANHAAYYPSQLSDNDRRTAVQATCRTGFLHNFSGASLVDGNGNTIANRARATVRVAFNYPLIASSDLPAGVQIANQHATPNPVRGAAVPISYNLSITQNGLMDLSYSINGGAALKVIDNLPITQSNGPLPASFRFGFSSGTGGGSNVHEITCFKAEAANQASSSAGTNSQPGTRVQAGSQVYLAYYNPDNSWGRLTARSLFYDAAADTLSIAQLANWDASCVLTGGACSTTNGSNTAQAPTARQILTWSGTAGIPLQWNSLSSAQQATLTSGDATVDDSRLRYLRGDRSNEVGNSPGGPYRRRTSVLGDIVNSSPTWVGPPASAHASGFRDLLYPAATPAESGYAAFQSARAGRTNMIYVGANDGLLHGFRTSGSGAVGPDNDGRELLAYMPSAVLSSIHTTTPALSFSSPQYSHNYYVDATPGTGDLYYGGAWRTWLVGGTGFGGNAAGPSASASATAVGSIFALDITDPSLFSESNAASIVKGDWTSSTITCANASDCNLSLGSSLGTPSIRRLHNGQWALLFGNGANSASGKAGLFIGLVDKVSGAVTFRFIDTGQGGSAGVKNGIAAVTATDLDDDRITDYVYAGDMLGNVWRFDLTSDNPGNWTVGATPLVSTGGAPITTRLAVGAVPTGSGSNGRISVIVGFGTGQQLPQTLTSAASHTGGSHALYGVWDWNMAGWNAVASAKAQYASLTSTQFASINGSAGAVPLNRLLAQSVTATLPGNASIEGMRTVSQFNVCWASTLACSGSAGQFGWRLPLPGSQEQVIYSPRIAYGLFVVNTTVPTSSQAVSCDAKPPSGYTMAVALGSGGAARSGFFPQTQNPLVAGLGLSATGTPSFMSVRNKPYLIQQRTDGKGAVTEVNPAADGVGRRLTWRKVR